MPGGVPAAASGTSPIDKIPDGSPASADAGKALLASGDGATATLLDSRRSEGGSGGAPGWSESDVKAEVLPPPLPPPVGREDGIDNRRLEQVDAAMEALRFKYTELRNMMAEMQRLKVRVPKMTYDAQKRPADMQSDDATVNNGPGRRRQQHGYRCVLQSLQ